MTKDWKEAAEKWLRDNNWDYQKYGDRRGDRSAYDTLMNYEIKEYLGDAFQAGVEHACEQLKQQLAECESRKEIWMKSDLQARDYANKLERRLEELENACSGINPETTDCGRCLVIHDAFAKHGGEGKK